MKFGVIFPQTEIGSDPAGVRDYAQAAESLGYEHLVVYDHVIGANPASRPGWTPPYTHKDSFHEPFVLFGYLAAATQKIELATGVVILPQRQTVLVAKQAAEVDLLTGGRLRLGVGIGWNAVEYEALGKDFGDRGARSEEQIALLRRLWTETTVSFEGRWERITGAGLAPLPVQRPIPIWIGGASERAYRRIGRIADGWFPMVPPGRHLDAARAVVDDAARAAGRDPASIGMEGRVSWGPGGIDTIVDHTGRWRDAGASHVAVNTMNAGLVGVDGHLAALEQAANALGVGERSERDRKN
jgi:probable F420-dependent oxidoreductase